MHQNSLYASFSTPTEPTHSVLERAYVSYSSNVSINRPRSESLTMTVPLGKNG